MALTVLNCEDAVRRDIGGSPFEEVGQRPKGKSYERFFTLNLV